MFSLNLNELSEVVAPNLGDSVGAIVGDVFTNYFLPASGIVLFLYLIFGGYEVMMSGGNPKSIASGQSKITNALIGFVIIFAAYWIVQGVSFAFGLNSFSEIFR